MSDTKEKCTTDVNHEWAPEGDARYHYEISTVSINMTCTLCGKTGIASWPMVPETMF